MSSKLNQLIYAFVISIPIGLSPGMLGWRTFDAKGVLLVVVLSIIANIAYDVYQSCKNKEK